MKLCEDGLNVWHRMHVSMAGMVPRAMGWVHYHRVGIYVLGICFYVLVVADVFTGCWQNPMCGVSGAL